MKTGIVILAIGVTLACAACSPRVARRGQPPGRSEPPESPAAKLLRADGLVERGCYLCLGDALAVYRELLGAGFQPALVRGRLFRTAVLMGVRERELGIVPAAGAEPTTPDEVEAGGVAYAEMAAAIPWPVSAVLSGLPDLRPMGMPPPSTWRAQLTPLADGGDPFAAYLLVAIDCSYGFGSSPAADFGRYTAAHPALLGLAFRVGICRPVNEQVLREVVAREPRFVEADFLLGEQCTRRGEAEQAEQHYRRVVERLPRLIAAPIALGGMLADGEEFEAALDAYDQALAIVPNHRQALLGRARCLSNLERHQEALGVCDTLIRLGEWYLGPAYYWRAWNLYALQDVQAASDAIQTAKQYLQTPEVFDLSGVIGFDRQDFGQARADLQEALRRDKSMCRPRFYLGRLNAEAGQWIAAAVSFAQAVDCYAAGAGAAAMKLDDVRRSAALSELRRARLLDRYRKQVAAGEHAAALAAYHTALSYANAEMPNTAIAYAKHALADDQLKAQAQELLAKLRK